MCDDGTDQRRRESIREKGLTWLNVLLIVLLLFAVGAGLATYQRVRVQGDQLLTIAEEGRAQRERLTALAEGSELNSRILVECTTAPADRTPPELTDKAGDCYAQNQERSAGIVKAVAGVARKATRDAAIAAAICGDPGRTVTEIDACVRKRLGADGKLP